jgi:hypothetical protein
VQRGSFDDADDAEGHNTDAAAPVQLSMRPVRTHSDDDASGGSGSDEESLIEQLQSQLGTGADDSASECDDNPERTYGLPTSDEEEGEECEDDEESGGEDEEEEEDDALQQLDPPQRHPSQRMVVESFSSKRTAPLRLQPQSSTRPRLHISRPISDSSRFGASADAAAPAVDAAGPPSPRASLSRQPSLREKRAAVRERCLRAMSERSFDLIFAHTLSQHILSPRSSAASQGAGGSSSSAFGFEPASPTGAGSSESARNLRVVHQLLRGAGASAADIAAASAELVFSIQQLVNLQQMLDGAHSIDHEAGP